MNVIPNIAITSVTTNDSQYSRKIDFGGPTGSGGKVVSLISAVGSLVIETASGRLVGRRQLTIR
jgi:hypothetical protein